MVFNGNGNVLYDFEFVSFYVFNGFFKINIKFGELDMCKDDILLMVKVLNFE